ncbi:cupin [Novosphingobium sp. FSY-8]|uniref:Cupin n=1 Tax=Novosphingobium ovatum TaxID=1908523 RepID=A0ABW9XGB4_9SPHN|nr:cupin [Novosphingobium ovatum]NBC37600.1 cupin [Novosphingobium ovatum]
MPRDLATHPVHLGLNATTMAEPAFTGMAWYADYVQRHAADGVEGRLVSLHDFDRDWDSWEMHPAGDEVVVCIAGEITLIQQIEGTEHSVTLTAGGYAINPRGVWHTANIAHTAQALFITAGWGTQDRPRD